MRLGHLVDYLRVSEQVQQSSFDVENHQGLKSVLAQARAQSVLQKLEIKKAALTGNLRTAQSWGGPVEKIHTSVGRAVESIKCQDACVSDDKHGLGVDSPRYSYM
jgi:hypothetical protein